MRGCVCARAGVCARARVCVCVCVCVSVCKCVCVQLWSGADDKAIRVWPGEAAGGAAELTGHTGGVLALCEVGPVWAYRHGIRACLRSRDTCEGTRLWDKGTAPQFSGTELMVRAALANSALALASLHASSNARELLWGEPGRSRRAGFLWLKAGTVGQGVLRGLWARAGFG